jgi:N-acyl-D-amino-acid deacylase
MEEKFGWKIDWKTMAGFFKRVEKEGISMNYVPLVGHGNIRFNELGMDYKRHATQQEIDQMIEQIHKSMSMGCYGMSTGMDYDPDVFASQDEIIQCVAALKEHDGVYSPHWRRTGRRRNVLPGTPPVERIDGIKDCIEVCKKTGVQTQIAHLAECYGIRSQGVAPPSLEKASGEATIQVIDDAIEEGLNVFFDYIPIPHYDLRTLPFLCSLFTPWIRELGSKERFAEWIQIEDYRKDVKDSLFAGKWHIRVRFSPVSNPRYWAKNVVVVKHKNSDYNMKTVEEIAKMRAADQLDTVFDLIGEDPSTRASTFYRSREIEKVFIKNPRFSVCLDSSVFDHTYQQKLPPYNLVKEGTFDGFISFLIRNVFDEKFITFEEAVKKLSTNAAKAYKLEGLGSLKPGYHADIVLLDVPNLKIMSDNLEPRRSPSGVEYVFVNGKKVVVKGKHTGAKAGKVLKKI